MLRPSQHQPGGRRRACAGGFAGPQPHALGGRCHGVGLAGLLGPQQQRLDKVLVARGFDRAPARNVQRRPFLQGLARLHQVGLAGLDQIPHRTSVTHTNLRATVRRALQAVSAPGVPHVRCTASRTFQRSAYEGSPRPMVAGGVQQPAARALTDERSRWRNCSRLITKSRCASAQDRAREVRAPSHIGNFTVIAKARRNSQWWS